MKDDIKFKYTEIYFKLHKYTEVHFKEYKYSQRS